MSFIRFELLTICLAILSSSCTSLPKGVEPVANFDLSAYLGNWYELARLDHRFERGLEGVTAEYSLRDDGGVRVVNRGYSSTKKQWKKIEGRAYAARGEGEGFLKVSFFGPFFSSYCVFELAPDGSYAFVSGQNHSYLWLLSRSPKVSDSVWRRFEERAQQVGFDTSTLVRVKHTNKR